MCGHGTYIDIRRKLMASHSIQHNLASNYVATDSRIKPVPLT